MKPYFLSIIFFLLLGNSAFGQQRESHLFKDPRRYIDTAVTYMDQNRYAEADEYFMVALEEINVLSADFCYYFGKNSYFLNKHSQSIDWLSKYLELKGSQGQYSEEVIALLDKAEAAFRETRTSTTSIDVDTKFFYLNTIKCDVHEKITCPVCKGDDVITTLDKLGERVFRACPYSTNGVLTCTEYNLLIQGKLKPKKN